MEHYDVVVIGAGHAGVEAANISEKYGLKTALITKNYSDLGKLSCNPSIGGVGKTHIASEVDILGGAICKIGDKSAIHYRVLNLSKGPAVWGVRAQIDRDLYSQNMKKFIKSSKIDLIEDENDIKKLKSNYRNAILTSALHHLRLDDVKNHLIEKIESKHIENIGKTIPDFASGDTIRVGYKITEGERTRIQNYEGVVIARKGGSTLAASFTVRKISFGEGVERVFPLYSTNIDSITVVRRGRVRRSKLYYLRGLRGKSARIAEKSNYKNENKTSTKAED